MLGFKVEAVRDGTKEHLTDLDPVLDVVAGEQGLSIITSHKRRRSLFTTTEKEEKRRSVSRFLIERPKKER